MKGPLDLWGVESILTCWKNEPLAQQARYSDYMCAWYTFDY